MATDAKIASSSSHAISDTASDCRTPTTASSSHLSLASASSKDDIPVNVLSPEEWHRDDTAVDRGLAFLASEQQDDGSFPSVGRAQPAVTSPCLLVFMSQGHTLGEDEY
jgi:hypothetical protein